MRDAGSLTLGVAERDQLREGAAALGVILNDLALQRFVAYAQLLDHWRRTTNLISCRSAEEFVDRHLLDALVCSWPCGAARTVADLGSGAGLPGMPLAIVEPTRRTVLVEPRRRRASFLREVKRELHLERVEILEIRAQEIQRVSVEPVDVAACRAVWSDEEVLSVAARWINDGGLLLCLRSDQQPVAAEDGSALGVAAGLRFEQSPTYRITDGPTRRIDVYRKGSPR